jgi:hypothetical protein
MGAVAKSHMRKGFLIYEEMRKYLVIYEEAVSLIKYDFATAPFWISLYMRKILFSFLSFLSVYKDCFHLWFTTRKRSQQASLERVYRY